MSDVFKIKLSADNYLVADHRIDGIRVLPGVAYLDIIARCFKTESFELTQVTYPHAAKILAGETIVLSVDYDSDKQTLVIFHHREDKKIVHFKAVIAFKKPDFPESIERNTAETASHAMSTLYTLARNSLIEHGEFMQVSGSTQINSSRIAMALTLSPKARPYLSRFYLHPALLDGATFAIAALHFNDVAQAGPEVTYLPLGIDKVSVFARVTTADLIVTAQTMATHHESLIKCRIHLFTPEGDLVVALEGLTNKRFQRRQFAQQMIQAPVNSVLTAVGDTQNRIAALIKNNLQDVPAVLEPQVSFFDLGLDSSSLIALVDVLEQHFNLELDPTLLFEQNTLEKLTAYIDACLAPKTSNQTQNPKAPPDVVHDAQISRPEVTEQDVAIIGMSLQLPDAETIEDLWRNLKTAKNSITKTQRNWPYTPYSWGGYLDDIAGFDPLFFNISPRDAALIDPQERLFLANAWHCLEDAGYAQIKEKNIGVIAASMFHLYQNYGVEHYQQDTQLKLPQSSGASIANRVSYALNLTGPSFSLDSMCSSSLTAIDLACRYLADSDVDAMLVGGVNVCSHPYKLASLVQNKFLSASGKSAPFQEHADGYIPGEGVVVLLLKKQQKHLKTEIQFML